MKKMVPTSLIWQAMEMLMKKMVRCPDGTWVDRADPPPPEGSPHNGVSPQTSGTDEVESAWEEPSFESLLEQMKAEVQQEQQQAAAGKKQGR